MNRRNFHVLDNHHPYAAQLFQTTLYERVILSNSRLVIVVVVIVFESSTLVFFAQATTKVSDTSQICAQFDKVH